MRLKWLWTCDQILETLSLSLLWWFTKILFEPFNQLILKPCLNGLSCLNPFSSSRNHTLINQLESASVRPKSVSCSHSNDVVLLGRQSPVNQNWLCLSFAQVYHEATIDYGNASSNPLLLRGAPDPARILCRNFTPKRHRQLWVKDLPKVPTWQSMF